MEDFEKNYEVGDEIEVTLSDGTHIGGKISKMFATGVNPAHPEYSDFTLKNIDPDIPSKNIKFSDVEDCRIIKKGNSD